MWFGEAYERNGVWRRMMRLVRGVYKLTERFPADEKSNLTASMRRAAVALPSQVAEGLASGDFGSLAAKLSKTRDGVRELQTLLTLAGRLGYASLPRRVALRRRLRRAATALTRAEARAEALASAATAPATPRSPRDEPTGERGDEAEGASPSPVGRLRFRFLQGAG